jgi:hypothetical protein
MPFTTAKAPLEHLQTILQALNADVFIYSGDITPENTDYLIKKIKQRPNRKTHLALVLTTYGGSPDAAYRLSKFLQKTYEKITLLVFGYCKSAGTMIAIGAHEIVMSDFGELGPLDIQVTKEGDLRRESSLNIQQSLAVLRQEAPQMFQECLIGIIDVDPEKFIPLKDAEEVAATMAIGLLKPIADQIDPTRLGELSRHTEIVMEYGKRLNPERHEAVDRLISDYPSHEFVIDYDEARKLLGDVVRLPNESETQLEAFLMEFAYEVVREPIQSHIVSLDELIRGELPPELPTEDDEMMFVPPAEPERAAVQNDASS